MEKIPPSASFRKMKILIEGRHYNLASVRHWVGKTEICASVTMLALKYLFSSSLLQRIKIKLLNTDLIMKVL